MFWNNLKELCSIKGISLNKMCNDLKISKSNINRWRLGGIPRSDTVNKISKYFNISIDELLADKKEKPHLNIEEIGLIDDMSLIDKKALELALTAAKPVN